MDNGTARCWGNNNVGQSHDAFPDSKAWLQVPVSTLGARVHFCGSPLLHPVHFVTPLHWQGAETVYPHPCRW